MEPRVQHSPRADEQSVWDQSLYLWATTIFCCQWKKSNTGEPSKTCQYRTTNKWMNIYKHFGYWPQTKAGTSNKYLIYKSEHGGVRCSSVVRAFAHGAMGRRIDPSWGEPLWAISRSSQCSTTGVTKAMLCAILSVGWCI